jgi:hypothetical protein
VALLSLAIATSSFRMQRREHRAFLRRLDVLPSVLVNAADGWPVAE